MDPTSVKPQVPKNIHDNDGHLGEKLTFKKESLLFYWSNIESKVTNYVEGCIGCQHNKSPTPSREIAKGIVHGKCFNDMVAIGILSGTAVKSPLFSLYRLIFPKSVTSMWCTRTLLNYLLINDFSALQLRL